MGSNLSSVFVPDTSGIVLSGPDKSADIILVIIWATVLYICAMLFSTCTLIDRWRGPYDKNETTLGNVLAAFLCSTAWPAVMAYVLVSQ